MSDPEQGTFPYVRLRIAFARSSSTSVIHSLCARCPVRLLTVVLLAGLTVQCAEPIGPDQDDRFVIVQLGRTHSCAMSISGAVFCWGAGLNGQLGRSDALDSELPVSVDIDVPFATLASGGSTNCGVLQTAALFCWGWNHDGQIGNGSTVDQGVPIVVANNMVFSSVTVGDVHTCALNRIGEPFCWGNGSAGQLGTGDLADRHTPVPMASNGTRFRQIAAGFRHTCGVALDGTGYCWGAGLDGELGSGRFDNERTPHAVTGTLRFLQIEAGEGYSCGLTTENTVYCWGLGFFVQPDGTAAEERVASPRPLPTPLTFTHISVARGFGCGVTPSRRAYCWGLNDASGRLGTGDIQNATGPRRIASDRRFVDIAAAAHHACAIDESGTVLCWGSNLNGQLGTAGDNFSNRPTPVRF